MNKLKQYTNELEKHYNEIKEQKENIDKKIEDEKKKIEDEKKKIENEKKMKENYEKEKRIQDAKEYEKQIKEEHDKFIQEQKQKENNIKLIFSEDEFNRLKYYVLPKIEKLNKDNQLYKYYIKLKNKYNDLIEDVYINDLNFFFFDLEKNIEHLRNEYSKTKKNEDYYLLFLNYYFWKLLNDVKDLDWHKLIVAKLDREKNKDKEFDRKKKERLRELSKDTPTEKMKFEANNDRIYNNLKLRKKKLQDFIANKRGINLNESYEKINSEINEHIKDVVDLYDLFKSDVKKEKNLYLDRIISEDVLDINERFITKLNIRKNKLNEIIAKSRGINITNEKKEIENIEKIEDEIYKNTLNLLKILNNEIIRDNLNLYTKYILDKEIDKNLYDKELEKTFKQKERNDRRKERIRSYIDSKRFNEKEINIEQSIENQMKNDNKYIYERLEKLSNEIKNIIINIRDDISLILIKNTEKNIKIYNIIQTILSYLETNNTYDKEKIFNELVNSFDLINTDKKSYQTLYDQLNYILNKKLSKLFNNYINK